MTASELLEVTGEHLCICGRWVHEHSAECGLAYPDGEPCRHFVPLCCEDCPCGSFAEGHQFEGAPLLGRRPRALHEDGPVERPF